MSASLKGDDLRQESTTTTHTPEGLKLFHGDHGLTVEHLTFIDEVMSEVGEGETVVKAFRMPDDCPSLEDAIFGPCNGDAAVTDDECYFASRADRPTKSRLLDREPRSGARWMVVIGTKGVALWSAYGSLSGTVAPKEADDPTLTKAEADEARKFWATHALARSRVVNRTPHPLSLVDKDGEVVRYPKPTPEELERVSRVEVDNEVVDYIGRFEDFDSAYGDIVNYPEDDGYIYVVSRVFIIACKKAGMNTSHLRSPGILLRDEENKVIGAKGLAR